MTSGGKGSFDRVMHGVAFLRKHGVESITLATRITASLRARDGAPSEIVQLYASEDAQGRRNEPCTCGSGRKWKHCHGAV